MTFPSSFSPEIVLYRVGIPVELRALISHYQIFHANNKTLREAAALWKRNKTDAHRIYGPISTWNTSKVTNMKELFQDMVDFNDDISAWDVSNVTDMECTFWNCSAFNQPLNRWNVSNVTNMRTTFANCSSFNQPLDAWDVSKVVDMYGLFFEASSFNQPLNNWNVGQVTTMFGMFMRARQFNQPLHQWNVSKVTILSNMFCGATSFNKPLNDWNVSKVTDMVNMFSFTPFNHPLDQWDVSQVTDMMHMFYHASFFNQRLNKWSVGINTEMGEMFNGADMFDMKYAPVREGYIPFVPSRRSRFDRKSHEVIVPITEVVIDELAVMRIVKHCNEHSPTIVAGSLLGLALNGVLEVTYSFAFPATSTDGESAIDGNTYQLEMMKLLRDVNIDNNCIGWYQSMYMGTVCTSDIVNYQYSYQSSEETSENSIVIMYDPLQSQRGNLMLKAYRLSKEYMELKKNDLNKFIKPSAIMEELPMTIRCQGPSAAFLRCLADFYEEDIGCEFDALKMEESEMLVERHVELMGAWVDGIVSEQQRFHQHVRVNGKARQENMRLMSERIKYARDNDEDPLTVRVENVAGLKDIEVSNRTDHLLMVAQLDNYCKQLNENIATTIHKLHLISSIHET